MAARTDREIITAAFAAVDATACIYDYDLTSPGVREHCAGVVRVFVCAALEAYRPGLTLRVTSSADPVESFPLWTGVRQYTEWKNVFRRNCLRTLKTFHAACVSASGATSSPVRLVGRFVDMARSDDLVSFAVRDATHATLVSDLTGRTFPAPDTLVQIDLWAAGAFASSTEIDGTAAGDIAARESAAAAVVPPSGSIFVERDSLPTVLAVIRLTLHTAFIGHCAAYVIQRCLDVDSTSLVRFVAVLSEEKKYTVALITFVHTMRDRLHATQEEARVLTMKRKSARGGARKKARTK